LAKVFLPITARSLFDVEVRRRTGTLLIDATFRLTQPWTIVFGPSGSGKTSILRAIAGLDSVDASKIEMQYVNHHGERKTAKPRECHTRQIPLATQEPNLFPHMTVRRQIEYGICLCCSKNFKDEDADPETVEEKTRQLLELFRINHLSERLPKALSGGEARRVNLARAAAAAMHLLLLDEPFTGLEASLRSELVHDLQVWAAERNLCVLSVTHDIAEAFQLNAEVIKIADGKVVQQGPVQIVLAEERARLLQQLNP
jgi:molybdate transport system ATP-binding protein